MSTDDLTVEEKLDKIMEAIHLQMNLLQQVLLSHDKLLKQLIVVQKVPSKNLITPNKEIIT